MSEYNCYHPQDLGILDSREKFVLIKGRINIYRKKNVFLFLTKWEFSWSFVVTSKTTILKFRPGENGHGIIELDNGIKKYEFLIYKKFEAFVLELKENDLNIS